MGVLQRFERRLEGLVEGAFAKVFGGVVQPVEVAGALQREAAEHKQVMGPGRILVPNRYVVEIGPTDLERFAEWDEQLRTELAGMVTEHAAEQGWAFVGDVEVAFVQVDDFATGVFKVRSSVVGTIETPAEPESGSGRPRLVLPRTSDNPERTVSLTGESTVLGRGAEADLRLPDTGVSRRHAELRVDGDRVLLTDLGSTNGTSLNGRRITGDAVLCDGDRIDLGASTVQFRST